MLDWERERAFTFMFLYKCLLLVVVEVLLAVFVAIELLVWTASRISCCYRLLQAEEIENYLVDLQFWTATIPYTDWCLCHYSYQGICTMMCPSTSDSPWSRCCMHAVALKCVVAVGRRRRQTDEIKPFRLSLILEFFQCHDVAFASMLQSLRSSKCTIYSFQMKQFPGPERQFASLYVGIGHHNHFIVIAINLPSPL